MPLSDNPPSYTKQSDDQQPPIAFDLLIDEIDWLITVDSERRIIKNGAVAISGNLIAAVGKSDEIRRLGKAKKTIHANGTVVCPGLVDCHIHTTFQLARGLADGVGPEGFLFERMYPYEASLVEDDAVASTRLCALELLKHGVTTFIDAGNYRPDITASVVGEAGMRCVIARSAFDIHRSRFGTVPDAFIESPETVLTEAEHIVKKWHGAFDGRIRAWFQFRGLNNTSDQLIVELKRLADCYRTGLQTHACFAESTVRASLSQHAHTEIDRLAHLACLDRNVLLAHAGWATPSELELLKQYDVKVVAAPSSSFHNAYGNIKNGKVPELLARGVAVGLGSDHASSGIVDLLQEMFLLSCGYKEARGDAAILPPEQIIEIATLGGARCALLESEIGSIEVGKQADIVIFDAQRPEWQPIYNPLSNMVYSATGSSVDTVIVGGRILVQSGDVLAFDEKEVIETTSRCTERILEKTKLWPRVRSTWPVV